MRRVYISSLTKDDNMPNSVMASWRNVIDANSTFSHGITSDFWVGVIDTDDEQHSLLEADSKVVYIDSSQLNTKIISLTTGQSGKISAASEIIGETRDILSIFSPQATVRDLVRMVVGMSMDDLTS